MISTTNNVPISKFIYDKVFQIKMKDVYNYYKNFDTNMFNKEFRLFGKTPNYVSFGTDGIIRDILFAESQNKAKSIYYFQPTYMMVPKYAETFGLKFAESTNTADILYLEFPNGHGLFNFSDLDLHTYISSHKDQKIILDLSYAAYMFRDVKDLYDFAYNISRDSNVYAIFGLSKLLGVPGLRIGFCFCKNPEIFNNFHQPWQVSSASMEIAFQIYNEATIRKHIEIIKESKESWISYFKSQYLYPVNISTGPFIYYPTSDYNHLFKNLGNGIYRFSVVDFEFKDSII